MREPVTIEVRPVGEEQKHARQLLWTGLALMAAGVLLMLTPSFINIIIASMIIVFGVMQLVITSIQGPLMNKTTGWITIATGTLILFFPQILNYFLIALYIALTIIFGIVLFNVGNQKWVWLLVGLALLGGLIMLIFPMSINIVFAIYLVIAGLEQLFVSYQSYYRWKIFN